MNSKFIYYYSLFPFLLFACIFNMMCDMAQVQIKFDHLVDLAKPNEAFDLLFQLFNLRKHLPILKSNFDQKKTMVMARVDTLTNKFYKMTLSSQKSGSQQDSNSQRGSGWDHPLTAISKHTTTLTTYGYVIKEILCNVRKSQFICLWPFKYSQLLTPK